MNDTLKAAGRIGAELGAAKAEVERLREALRWYEEKVAECRKIGSLGDNARQALDLDGGFRARDALSPQAEPTDTYTAVDMATAAAQGFRDGQAAVEQATAKDETEPVYQFQWREIGEGDWIACSHSWFRFCEASPERDTRVVEVTRPAQTEQQPKIDYKRKFECLVEHAKRQDKAIADMRYDENIRRYYDDGAVWFWAGDDSDNLETLACPVVINAGDLRALIAQTAPQGKFRMGDLVKKSTGSEWVGRICGTYSTALTPEGYAVESEAHAGSVQIYPAKALEAVE